MITFEETAPALKPLAKRYRNTRLEACAGEVTLWLHATPIVSVYPSGLIQLSSGGWHTVTTKKRMNEALHLLGADFQIVQRAFEWYTWNWYTQETRDFMGGQVYRRTGTLSQRRHEMIIDKEHVGNEGAQCPYCHSGEIEGGSVDTGGGGAQQEMFCLDCEANWIDRYELTGWEENA